MTDRDLALALIQAKHITREQAQEAAKLRGPGKKLAHVLIEQAWTSREIILQIDSQAFEFYSTTPAPSSASNGQAPAPLSGTTTNAGAINGLGTNGHSANGQATNGIHGHTNGNGASNGAPPVTAASLNNETTITVLSPTAETNGTANAENSDSSEAVVPAEAASQLTISNVGLGHEEPAALENEEVILDGEMQETDDDGLNTTVRICNEILLRAVQMGASDIHLEPRINGLLPRFRIDGHLRASNQLPREMLASIVSRFKVMANLNITETRLSQDGRFRATVGGHRLDFRVSTLPGIHGEKVVMRLLDHSALVTDLGRLGFNPDVHEQFEEMLRRAHGMILVTGPTGSGKSTTLYAALASTLDPSKNVVTVEDPVEYELEGVMQCHVHAEIGNTFAARLRSILRQDPDVILIGEIRDTETADMAVRAALTGHLMLSTLHTNSAAASVARLQDMGVPPFLIASSLSGILAQRLVRLICQHCRQPVAQDSREYDIAVAELALTHGITMYHGAGCEHCHGTGYRGRVAIMELLNVNKEIRRAIMDRIDTDRLHTLAMENGMRTLYQDGLDKLQRGLTTSEELARILLGNEEIELR